MRHSLCHIDVFLGAQRFPDYNFVKYEELLDGKLSYKRFSNGFSVVTPEMYICTGNGFSLEPSRIYHREYSALEAENIYLFCVKYTHRYLLSLLTYVQSHAKTIGRYTLAA